MIVCKPICLGYKFNAVILRVIYSCTLKVNKGELYEFN